MLYTLEDVRAGLRMLDGKRVFYLGANDRLTPAAQDWLRQEKIRVADPREAKTTFTTLFGGEFAQKPEEMTHLTGNILVPKDHPRIVYRGMVDALEAEILTAQIAVRGHRELNAALEEMLGFVRELMRSDVTGEPLGELKLCQMDEGELRERSHFPQKYYGQPHFIPAAADGAAMAALNRLRTLVRQTEIACFRAYSDRDGRLTRLDLLTALNRLSSLCWILMLRLKKGEL